MYKEIEKDQEIKDVGNGVYTSYTGHNSVLIREISKILLKKGDKIADITYGKGVFWKDINLSRYKFYPSDLMTCPNAPYDFTSLPYEKETFNVVVFDPPYVHNPGNLIVNDNYQNKETTKGMYHKDIMELYEKGMKEALRILKKDGTLWVKCKDEVESSIQRWSHIELFHIANQLGLYALDFFVLTQVNLPIIQHKKQNHARKNHSYLWVFAKIENKDKRLVVQKEIIDALKIG